jgi:hypothetical protein
MASVFRVENRSHRVLRNIGGTYLPICGGPGSIVGIANILGWTVRGSNPGGGQIFRTCPDRPWGPPSLLYNGYRVFSMGKERLGREADPSPSSSAVGHEIVELYLYSPYGLYDLYRTSVPVQGCTLPYLYLIYQSARCHSPEWPSLCIFL